MTHHVFHDRTEAGRRLGRAVAEVRPEHAVVLGLPRGGVPVAAAVAAALHAPLDVIVVRKLGVPSQPELAMGAIGEDSTLVVNDEIVAAVGVGSDEFARVEARQRVELDRRVEKFRRVRPRESLVGRTAVLVDDGIATGATMRAAVDVARRHGATRVIVASPVAPPDVAAMMRHGADDVVILSMPDDFRAVGDRYEDFSEVTDDEVVRLLAEAWPPEPDR